MSFNLANDFCGTSTSNPLIAGHLAAILEERLALVKRCDANNLFFDVLRHDVDFRPTNGSYLP